MHNFTRTLTTAVAAVAILAGVAVAQSDRYYDRERYRYDDYGNRQQYDPYNDRYERPTTQRRTGYADLFETQRRADDVYGYDEPVYAPPTRQTVYRGQTITGQVRELSNVTHDDVQHRHVTVRTETGRTMTVDLGPTNQLGGLNLERGERVRIAGQYRTINGGDDEFVADRIQVDDEQRLLIDRELKHQWIVGNVVSESRTGFTLRTDQGRQVLVDLGPAADQVDLHQGQRIQALGTLAQIDGRTLMLATQLRSLRGGQFTTQPPRQPVEEEQEDDDDQWRDLGQNILRDIFR